MRVLISGGTGLLGGALTESLLGDGHEVGVLTRSLPDDPPPRPGLRFLVWDARTAGDWAEEAASFDHWVHLAGENVGGGRWTASRKRRIRDSRLRSGAALVEAATRLGSPPRVLLQASGVGYYGGAHASDTAIVEDAPAGDDFLGRLAVEWEGSTVELESLGTRRAVLRTGVVLARDGGALPRLVLPYRLFVGGSLGSGRQWIPWIHLDDQVRAMRFLLGDERGRGAFNLVAPNPVEQREFGRTLGDVLGRPHWLPVPAPVLRALLGEMATVVLEGPRAVPARLTALGFSFAWSELEGALRDLLRRPSGGGA